jgi:pimeloyl-ACP methyl ester carboxylesterase
MKPKSKSNVPRLGPVFFMHGMMATAGDYLMTGPKIGLREMKIVEQNCFTLKYLFLAFLLADNGYDIWFGNARGNDHSLRHKTLSFPDRAFWNFSWHEIGLYDVSAMIDFVLKKTNSAKTFYVGHSQGTTSLLVLLSTRPEYNQKIIQTHLLAPAIFMENFPHALSMPFVKDVEVKF